MANRVGQRIDNYVLTRLLGAGAFGEVYLAEHIYRKNQVAVKILPQLADNDLPNFLNEARTIRLRHPNIVQVLDFGVADRIPFIVMEYIPKGTLRQRYPQGTKLSPDSIVLYVNQIAAALKYAHDEKLIHRDVKPENILLRSDAEVVLSDFGIVAMAHSSRSQSLQEMAGTITYMAPEQLHGRPVVASDQYALGVIVYEWLCGERPFKGTSMEIATQHMLTTPSSLLEKVPGMPSSVQRVVFTALEKDPSKRFTNIQVFANALEQAAHPFSPQLAPPPILSLPPENKSLPAAPSPRPTKETQTPNFRPATFEAPKPIPTPSPSLVTNTPSYEVSRPAQFDMPIIANGETNANERKRKRLRVVTIPLALLLIAGLVSGIFFALHLNQINQNQAISQVLNNAQQLIIHAQNETAINPASALNDLSSAQNALNNLAKTQTLDGNQTGQLTSLQNKLVMQVNSAIGQYNRLNHIFTLPCSLTSIHPVNITSATIQPQNIVAVQNGTGAGTSRFTLGKDGSVYQITNQFSLVSVLPGSPASTNISIASGGSQLFTLSEQLINGVPAPDGYMLSMYMLDQTGKLTPFSTVTIDPTFINGGYTPVSTAFTAWGSNAYVVLANQNQGRILKYAPGGKNYLLAASTFNFSTSASIISVTTFANQFFMLFSDGSVKSLPITATGINPSDLFIPVLPTSPIPAPLSIAGNYTTPSTPVPTVISTQYSNTPLIVSTATTLASGVVNSVPHLYIGNSMNHRVLDLVIPASRGAGTPTTTATPASPGLTMQLNQQFVYAQFNTVKSIAVDPQGATINILAQNASQLNLVSVSSGLQTGCATS